jgi:hypothetical protein
MVQVTASSPPGRLVLKREKRDETAEYDEPDVVIPSSKWLRLTMSEAVVEASLRQAQGKLAQRTNAG